MPANKDTIPCDKHWTSPQLKDKAGNITRWHTNHRCIIRIPIQGKVPKHTHRCSCGAEK